jgi:chromosome partitioning protein
MKSIVVINPKGGSGKTTASTTLAGALARGGERVRLWDLDRQKSALAWLGLRAPELPVIETLDADPDDAGATRGRAKVDWLVIDSPAGLHGKTLGHTLKLADKVVVPVQPSLFDMAATADFLTGLRDERAGRRGGLQVGIVGMRVDPRTRAASTLQTFLSQFGLPVLAYIRDTQQYANAAFSGQSVFDLPDYLAARDAEQWEPVIEWLHR